MQGPVHSYYSCVEDEDWLGAREGIKATSDTLNAII